MSTGTCPLCNQMHDPHLPCPDSAHFPENKKPSKKFKGVELKARVILLIIAICAGIIFLYIGLCCKPIR